MICLSSAGVIRTPAGSVTSGMLRPRYRDTAIGIAGDVVIIPSPASTASRVARRVTRYPAPPAWADNRLDHLPDG